MTVAMDARSALHLGAELDPATINITHHALERYVGRRHTAKADLQDAEARLRDLLSRCAHQRPPVRVHPEKGASRTFLGGGFVFIVSADCGHLITFWRSR